MSILIGFVVEEGPLVRDLSPQLVDLSEEPFIWCLAARADGRRQIDA